MMKVIPKFLNSGQISSRQLQYEDDTLLEYLDNELPYYMVKPYLMAEVLRNSPYKRLTRKDGTAIDIEDAINLGESYPNHIWIDGLNFYSYNDPMVESHRNNVIQLVAKELGIDVSANRQSSLEATALQIPLSNRIRSRRPGDIFYNFSLRDYYNSPALRSYYLKMRESGLDGMSGDMKVLQAMLPELNLVSPTQLLGATARTLSNIGHGRFDAGKTMEMYFEGNNGIVTDNFARNHPYWSMGINMGGDLLLGNPKNVIDITKSGAQYLDDIARTASNNLTPPPAMALAGYSESIPLAITGSAPKFNLPPNLLWNGVTMIPTAAKIAKGDHYMADIDIGGRPRTGTPFASGTRVGRSDYAPKTLSTNNPKNPLGNLITSKETDLGDGKIGTWFHLADEMEAIESHAFANRLESLDKNLENYLRLLETIQKYREIISTKRSLNGNPLSDKALDVFTQRLKDMEDLKILWDNPQRYSREVFRTSTLPQNLMYFKTHHLNYNIDGHEAAFYPDWSYGPMHWTHTENGVYVPKFADLDVSGVNRYLQDTMGSHLIFDPFGKDLINNRSGVITISRSTKGKLHKGWSTRGKSWNDTNEVGREMLELSNADAIIMDRLDAWDKNASPYRNPELNARSDLYPPYGAHSIYIRR